MLASKKKKQQKIVYLNSIMSSSSSNSGIIICHINFFFSFFFLSSSECVFASLFLSHHHRQCSFDWGENGVTIYIFARETEKVHWSNTLNWRWWCCCCCCSCWRRGLFICSSVCVCYVSTCTQLLLCSLLLLFTCVFTFFPSLWVGFLPTTAELDASWKWENWSTSLKMVAIFFLLFFMAFEECLWVCVHTERILLCSGLAGCVFAHSFAVNLNCLHWASANGSEEEEVVLYVWLVCMFVCLCVCVSGQMM